MNGGTLLRRVAAALLAISILLATGTPAGPVARAWSNVPADDRVPEGFHPGESVVVFAAHPDDETLGAGGLIHQAVAAGARVTIVIATNGDGYLGGVDVRFRTLLSTPGRFIQYGRTRQDEALRAAAQLGVPAAGVLFLGYPDRGLAALWGSHWDCGRPYTSPYTRQSRSPYTLAYRRGAVYCGNGVLADVAAILAGTRPALVVVHHPADTHRDHWAVAAFVTLAIEQAALAGDGWAREARVYHYLIHYGPGWPLPRAYAPDQPLAPPAGLAVSPAGPPAASQPPALRPRWVTAPLRPADEDAKRGALFAYRSQLALSRTYLMSFVRRGELFDLCPGGAVTALPGGEPSLSQPEQWDRLPVLIGAGSPSSLLRAAQGAAALDGVAVGRTADRLLLAVRLRRPARREVGYRLELRLFDPDGRVRRLTLWFAVPASLRAEQRGPADLSLPAGSAARVFGRRIHVTLPLAALGQPAAAYVRVTTVGALRTAVDHTPWTLVRIGLPAGWSAGRPPADSAAGHHDIEAAGNDVINAGTRTRAAGRGP